jgi:hypothetical protein
MCRVQACHTCRHQRLGDSHGCQQEWLGQWVLLQCSWQYVDNQELYGWNKIVTARDEYRLMECMPRWVSHREESASWLNAGEWL